MTAAANNMHEMMQRCIANCTECHAACEKTLSYCLKTGGMHAEEFHVKSLIDCAQSCTVSADFMLRGSSLHPKMCGICSEACMLCAETCDQMGNDREMKKCADICRRCADSCRQMAESELPSFGRKAA